MRSATVTTATGVRWRCNTIPARDGSGAHRACSRSGTREWCSISTTPSFADASADSERPFRCASGTCSPIASTTPSGAPWWTSWRRRAVQSSWMARAAPSRAPSVASCRVANGPSFMTRWARSDASTVRPRLSPAIAAVLCSILGGFPGCWLLERGLGGDGPATGGISGSGDRPRDRTMPVLEVRRQSLRKPGAGSQFPQDDSSWLVVSVPSSAHSFR